MLCYLLPKIQLSESERATQLLCLKNAHSVYELLVGKVTVSQANAHVYVDMKLVHSSSKSLKTRRILKK